MASKTELADAVKILDKAKNIVEAHLVTPIEVKDVYDYRQEMYRRMEAVDSLHNALLRVRRLDPDYAKRSAGPAPDMSIDNP